MRQNRLSSIVILVARSVKGFSAKTLTSPFLSSVQPFMSSACLCPTLCRFCIKDSCNAFCALGYTTSLIINNGIRASTKNKRIVFFFIDLISKALNKIFPFSIMTGYMFFIKYSKIKISFFFILNNLKFAYQE